MHLKDKVAIVTGASRGIGRAIALDLSANGAQVVINYNSSAAAAEAVVAEIQAAGGVALAVQADVSEFEAAQNLTKTALATFGRVDILVNNAGTTRDTLLMRMSEDDWDTVIDTNLKSVFNCCKAVMRPMIRGKRGGRIINISSVSGLVGQSGQTNYSASKAGIIGFSKALAKELASRAITVNTVAPGFFLTSLTENLDAALVEKTREFIPLGRWGELHEVAHLVTFLASNNSSYITGEVIRVDGGMTM